MPPLKNARREKFAQELAKGKTATEAMANAGYRSDPTNSHKFTNNSEVRARLTELHERSANRAGVTKQSLSERLDEAYNMAKRLEKPEAMTGAVREQGILHGIRIERQEHGGAGEFDALADMEFADRMKERLDTAMAVVEQGNATEH